MTKFKELFEYTQSKEIKAIHDYLEGNNYDDEKLWYWIEDNVGYKFQEDDDLEDIIHTMKPKDLKKMVKHFKMK